MAKVSLTVVMPGRAFGVDLPLGRAVLVGRAAPATVLIPSEGLLARHLSLTAREDAVEVEAWGPNVSVNDVPLSGAALARAGDELKIGEATLIVVVHQPVTPPRRTCGHDELLARLADETARAQQDPGRRTVGWVMIGLPPLNALARQAMLRRLWDETAKANASATWGELSVDLIAAVVPELDAEALEALFAKVKEAAGARSKVAFARWPDDGPDAECLLEQGFERLFPSATWDDELVMVDPVMVRLLAAAEQVPGPGAPIAAVGGPGVGRSRLLRSIAEGRGLTLHTVEAVQAARAPETLGGGAWLLRHFDRISAADQGALTARAEKKGAWLLATGQGFAPERFALQLPVPPLLDRPTDVLPLAESFLRQFRARLDRPKLALGAEARAVLSRYRWPGNVRELRNVIARAARAALRDEVGRDALFDKLSSEGPAENLRGALKVAERDLLLEALARTRWNVTQAASRLGLPRRTVVYRMSRLGLKRPAR